MADTSEETDSIDLSEGGAGDLASFIARFFDGKGKGQPLLRIFLDDGTEVDKAEIVAVTDDDSGAPIFELHLSGI